MVLPRFLMNHRLTKTEGAIWNGLENMTLPVPNASMKINGVFAQPRLKVDRPRIKTAELNTVRAPKRSTAKPTAGETAEAVRPPRLTPATSKVRLQPISREIGYTNTARVRPPTALRTNCDEPAAVSTIHP